MSGHAGFWVVGKRHVRDNYLTNKMPKQVRHDKIGGMADTLSRISGMGLNFLLLDVEAGLADRLLT